MLRDALIPREGGGGEEEEQQQEDGVEAVADDSGASDTQGEEPGDATEAAPSASSSS